MKKTPGEIAYEAYCKARDWKSVRGEPLPAYAAQAREIKEAWEMAGKAVAADMRMDQSPG